MALRIELWTEAGLVDGIEQWWDDVDAWVLSAGDIRVSYPLTASIDPYGFGVISGADIGALRAELVDIMIRAPEPVAVIAASLERLCERGLASMAPQLRLVGD